MITIEITSDNLDARGVLVQHLSSIFHGNKFREIMRIYGKVEITSNELSLPEEKSQSITINFTKKL